MTLPVKFTLEAEEKYLSVVTQLQYRWGDQYLAKFEAKLLKIFDTISKTPYLYPVDKQFTELRKCVPHKNCSMFYKVNNDHILIAYFWDNRQDPLILP